MLGHITGCGGWGMKVDVMANIKSSKGLYLPGRNLFANMSPKPMIKGSKNIVLMHVNIALMSGEFQSGM